VTTVNDIEARAEPVGSKTIQKLRFRILPYLLLLYIIAYLDWIDIGFAALTMNKELGIGSQQFGLLVGIFFFGYFLFEIPSNLLLHKLGARVWIACILITCGTVAMLSGFVHSVHQLYVARFLLGANTSFKPGIGPSTPIQTTMCLDLEVCPIDMPIGPLQLQGHSSW